MVYFLDCGLQNEPMRSPSPQPLSILLPRSGICAQETSQKLSHLPMVMLVPGPPYLLTEVTWESLGPKAGPAPSTHPEPVTTLHPHPTLRPAPAWVHLRHEFVLLLPWELSMENVG